MNDPCRQCKGHGFTEEHDYLENHDPRDGNCLTCPVQVPCQECEGTGVGVQHPVVDGSVEPREAGADQG